MNKRAIVLSDVHAQPWLIRNALKHSNFDQNEDKLIFSGDFVDIGDRPEECYQLLKDNNAIMIWGNHEAAIILNKHISPQDPYSFQLREDLIHNMDDFKIATYHDDVLITHAGLSTNWKINSSNLHDIVSELNNTPLKNFWEPENSEGPLWYRPNKRNPPLPIKQVVGHTPPVWIEQSSGATFSNLYVIDPYCVTGFNKQRYRYATIIDGNVTIYDSNDIKRN